MAALRGFITNLGLYNEGELRGEWIEFPIDEDELNEVLDRIGINEEYEEYFFTDYECDLDCFDASSLGEYENIEDLNEIGEKLEKIDDLDLNDEVDAGIAYGLSLNDAIDKAVDGEIIFVDENSNGRTDENLAYAFIESLGGIEELSKGTIDMYIDSESLGRDVRLEYYAQDEEDPETAGEYWCGDEDASDEEIGDAIIDQLGLDGINNKESYFDYETFGRDLRLEGTYVETNKGIYEILY